MNLIINVPQISIGKTGYENDLRENGRIQMRQSEQESAALMEHQLSKFSKACYLVLDASARSNSTGKACLSLNKHSIFM